MRCLMFSLNRVDLMDHSNPLFIKKLFKQESSRNSEILDIVFRHLLSLLGSFYSYFVNFMEQNIENIALGWRICCRICCNDEQFKTIEHHLRRQQGLTRLQLQSLSDDFFNKFNSLYITKLLSLLNYFVMGHLSFFCLRFFVSFSLFYFIFHLYL